MARSLTQQSLAERAEVSTRHLSFLETERASPSREMVLVLGSALDLPLRDRNRLLVAAGFAPVYQHSPLDSARMTRIQRAIDHILAQQEPYGALVVDRLWNIKQLNQGAARMFAFFAGASAPQIVYQNLMHAVFHPDGLRPWIVDWESVAAVLAERLHRETIGPGGGDTRSLVRSLLDYPDVPEHLATPDPTAEAEPFLPLHLRKGDADIRLFTIVGTLGTPLDVTAQELRLECYFPADDASDAWIRAFAVAPE